MKVKLSAGAELDLLTQGELDSSLGKWGDDYELAKLRGIKWMELPDVLHGVASGSAITLGATGARLGPEEGYIWSLTRLVVSGLTTGTTPDVVNLYRNDTARPPLWQFNGNNFAYTFGKLAMTIRGGDFLILASVGTFAATGTIQLSGELIEVPAQLAGKLA